MNRTYVYFIVKQGKGLLDFLFQTVEHGRVEELSQRDIQPVAQLFDEIDGDFPPVSVQHAVDGRRRDPGEIRELVRPHVPRLHDLPEPLHHRVLNTHIISPQRK